MQLRFPLIKTALKLRVMARIDTGLLAVTLCLVGIGIFDGL